MSDYPTWSERKAFNNDGMDPDWRPTPVPEEDAAFDALAGRVTTLEKALRDILKHIPKEVAAVSVIHAIARKALESK